MNPVTANTSTTASTIVNLVNDQNVSDVKLALISTKCWDITGDTCETIGHIAIGISACISFGAGIWELDALSYTAGAINIGSMALIKFAQYANNQSKDRATFVNNALTELKIDAKFVDVSPTTNFDNVQVAPTTI